VLEAFLGKFAILTDNLSRSFGAVCAVDRLNLAVPSGESFGLLGPTGAGKTTVIRLLLGLLEPTRGSAEVLGYDIRSQADQIRLRSGAVFADAGLYDRLSVAENLDYYGRIWHMPAAERRDRSRDLLGRLQLWDVRAAAVGLLTSLQRRRLSLARALIHRPALLCVDEPTQGLDPAAADAFRADLSQLIAHQGVTTLLALPGPAEAEALCSAVAVMRQGQIIQVGPVSALRSRSAAPTVEVIGRGFTEQVISLLRRRPEIAAVRRIDNRLLLQLAGEFDTAPLVSLLVESSVDVEEVRKHTASVAPLFVPDVQEEDQP
jgi:ABC-2 type transport system ATP-binding protein